MKLPFPFREKESPPSHDHIHEWELVAKTFVEPKPFTSIDNTALSRLALTGMTTYLFQCTKCAAFQKNECEGVEETSLSHLFEKVDISGPEYISHEGKIYILMRRPDDHPPGIPVRR